MSESVSQTKVCNVCGKRKPLVDFSPRKAAADGRRYECKTCCCVASKQYFIKNQSQRRDYGKNRYWTDPERFKNEAKEQRLKNPEIHRNLVRRYRSDNLDKCRQLTRDWSRRQVDAFSDSYINLSIRNKVKRIGSHPVTIAQERAHLKNARTQRRVARASKFFQVANLALTVSSL